MTSIRRHWPERRRLRLIRQMAQRDRSPGPNTVRNFKIYHAGEEFENPEQVALVAETDRLYLLRGGPEQGAYPTWEDVAHIFHRKQGYGNAVLLRRRNDDLPEFFRRANLFFENRTNPEGKIGDIMVWLRKQPLIIKVPVTSALMITFCFFVYHCIDVGYGYFMCESLNSPFKPFCNVFDKARMLVRGHYEDILYVIAANALALLAIIP
eukprot:SAG11_NODE_8852_length_969_cov_35.613793_2_plen_208_part_01